MNYKPPLSVQNRNSQEPLHIKDEPGGRNRAFFRSLWPSPFPRARLCFGLSPPGSLQIPLLSKRCCAQSPSVLWRVDRQPCSPARSTWSLPFLNSFSVSHSPHVLALLQLQGPEAVLLLNLILIRIAFGGFPSYDFLISSLLKLFFIASLK